MTTAPSTPLARNLHLAPPEAGLVMVLAMRSTFTALREVVSTLHRAELVVAGFMSELSKVDQSQARWPSSIQRIGTVVVKPKL